MKNIFSKRILVSIILIIMLVLISAGCGGGGGGGGDGIIPPPLYTLSIISQHPWCYGTVYVNGLPTNAYLLTWGSATVYNVPSGAAIYLVDTAGFQSHTEIFNPILGTTIIFNYWW